MTFIWIIIYFFHIKLHFETLIFVRKFSRNIVSKIRLLKFASLQLICAFRRTTSRQWKSTCTCVRIKSHAIFPLEKESAHLNLFLYRLSLVRSDEMFHFRSFPGWCVCLERVKFQRKRARRLPKICHGPSAGSGRFSFAKFSNRVSEKRVVEN